MTVEAPVHERQVASCWEQQSFDRSALERLRLHVIFRGMPSDAGGPDYQDAILSLGTAGLVHGDIEFHVHTSDWFRHGHQRDARYNRVILHVVWDDDGIETVRQDGSMVPVLAVGTGEADSVAGECDGTMRLPLFRCSASFERRSESEVRAALRSLGVARFGERIDRLAADLAVESVDQVAYRALLEGLGYASNRSAFARLADAVPFAWLHSIPSCERLPTLLDAAGLGPPAPVPPPAHVPPGSWRLVRLRPSNHPVRRLHAFARLLAALSPSPALRLSELVLTAQRPRELREGLIARDGDGAIGPGRADELAVSVALPLTAALCPEASRPLELFEAYPTPPSNRWTRHMLELIESAGHVDFRVRSATEHQGLHHLYHSFCRPGNEVGCPLCRSAGA